MCEGGNDHTRANNRSLYAGEKLSVDISASMSGDGLPLPPFYHMHAGMMQVVSVLDEPPMRAQCRT